MKRIAAIVLPKLACELARRKMGTGLDAPFGVILDEEQGGRELDEREHSSAVLVAVDERALRYGARPGQRVTEAAAFVGRLQAIRLSLTEIRQALGEVAEVALGLGTTAAIELAKVPGARSNHYDTSCHAPYPGGAGAGPEDTVWLDVSGCARLTGGEDVLCTELRDRVAVLGHCVRVTIADGPRIARAVARWAQRRTVVAREEGARALGALPIASLPLEPEGRAFLGKLGILSVSELGAIDRARLSSRLGEQAQDLLELMAGHDALPLLPYTPAPTIAEHASFEHEIVGSEPLLFVLGGLVSRAAARLESRGEAAAVVRIVLEYDRAAARLAELRERAHCLIIEPPVPLGNVEGLTRAVRAKIEACELAAPVVAVTLTLEQLRERSTLQLDLSRRADGDPRAFPALLAELEATLGPGSIGTLHWSGCHRPEAQSVLRAVALDGEVRRPQSADGKEPSSLGAPGSHTAPWWWQPTPTRLLPAPSLLGHVAAGSLVTIDREIRVVDRLRFELRLDRIEWWSAQPLSRDYVRLWMHSAGPRSTEHEHATAWAYVDPTTGEAYLHGWFE